VARNKLDELGVTTANCIKGYKFTTFATEPKPDNVLSQQGPRDLRHADLSVEELRPRIERPEASGQDRQFRFCERKERATACA
jgi:hypothetical protein